MYHNDRDCCRAFHINCAIWVSAALLVSSLCLGQSDPRPSANGAPPLSPSADPTVSAGRIPAKENKRLAKYDALKIGQREVGKGLNFYSFQRERELGQQIARRIDRNIKFLHDQNTCEYVDRLTQKLARNSDTQAPFTTKVIDSDEVSAFSLPGGLLYISTGLIGSAESEAELAGVIAHEVAHVAARHGTRAATRRALWNSSSLLFYLAGPVGFTARQIAAVGVAFWLKKLDRNAEREADVLGIQYEYAAGYDPQAMIEFLERQKTRAERSRNPIYRAQTHNKIVNSMTSHPITDDRIRRAQNQIALLPASSEYVISTADFEQVKARVSHLSNLCGSTLDASPVLRRPGDKRPACNQDVDNRRLNKH